MSPRNLLPVGLFLAAAAWSVSKGILPQFQIDETYFWLANYGDGLARRSLIGTLLLPFNAEVTPDRIHALGAGMSLTFLAVTVALMAELLYRDFGFATVAQRSVVAVLAGGSPLLGLLAFHVGYPDGIVASLMLLAGRRLGTARGHEIAVMLLICSLVHEMSTLLLVPLVLLACVMRQDWRTRDVVYALGGAVVSITWPAFGRSNASALTARLMQAGIEPSEAAHQSVTFLHQTIGTAVGVMSTFWRTYPVNGVLGMLYGAVCAMCILWAPRRMRFLENRWEPDRISLSI